MADHQYGGVTWGPHGPPQTSELANVFGRTAQPGVVKAVYGKSTRGWSTWASHATPMDLHVIKGCDSRWVSSSIWVMDGA
jgi:hypothetical protein